MLYNRFKILHCQFLRHGKYENRNDLCETKVYHTGRLAESCRYWNDGKRRRNKRRGGGGGVKPPLMNMRMKLEELIDVNISNDKRRYPATAKNSHHEVETTSTKTLLNNIKRNRNRVD